jgi:hypothetical protein
MSAIPRVLQSNAASLSSSLLNQGFSLSSEQGPSPALSLGEAGEGTLIAQDTTGSGSSAGPIEIVTTVVMLGVYAVQSIFNLLTNPENQSHTRRTNMSSGSEQNSEGLRLRYFQPGTEEMRGLHCNIDVHTSTVYQR